MNKVFERRRNEFHATCDDIPVFQLGAVVFRHGFVAQGDGWDSNRSILARAICWRQGNGWLRAGWTPGSLMTRVRAGESVSARVSASQQ